MKIKLSILLLLSTFQSLLSQTGFYFETDKDKIVIPFQLINNLIFIPINVNGVELTFLLDSGVDETVILSIDDNKEININNIEKIKLSGLGNELPIDGLKSKENVLSLNHYVDRHHTIYVVLDEEFNFSNSVGIPVNGIIGYHFFKNNLIEINYANKKIIIHKNSLKIQNKFKNQYTAIPITIEKNKPYTSASIFIESVPIESKLLLDIGNSDAIWIFQGTNYDIKIPKKSFDDFLGKGFSGEIFGKRTKISKFSLDKFEFNLPIVVMPDTISTKSVKMVENRLGSIGGEIFKRFNVVFDYKNAKMYLKKNGNYDHPFEYNLSGIVLQNEGTEWVQETVAFNTSNEKNSFGLESSNNTVNNFKYKFSLKPVYSIAILRQDSPAAKSGLRKGDIVKSINNKAIYKNSLQKNNEILKSEDGKWIKIEIERDSQIFEYKFQVKDIL
jgi:hypothetical protein